MLVFIVSFVVSCGMTFLVIKYDHLHGHFTSDHDTLGVQKFHTYAVPRIGGFGVFMGVVSGLLALRFNNISYEYDLKLIFCGIFALLAGMLEDITKKIGVSERLLATAISGLFGGWFLGGWISRFDIEFLDAYFFAIPLVASIITCIAVAGVSNSYNIIDGYNGLAGGVAVMTFTGIGYTSLILGDIELFFICIAIIGSMLGFLIWNYPRGCIFLGDGGAYFIGFVAAEISILLVARHENVSAWFAVLVNLYPIYETLFSIYRKKIKRGHSPGMPDGMHLHMLVYKRLVRRDLSEKKVKYKTMSNSLVSPYLWILNFFPVVSAVLFMDSTISLIACAIVFVILYGALYRMIIKFKAPRFLVLN